VFVTSVPHVLSKDPELFLVVGPNDRSYLSRPRLLALGVADRIGAFVAPS